MKLRAGWPAALSAAAVLAVNAAGLWGIAVARRGALEEARRAFRNAVESRGRDLEGRLAAMRADLAFLAASAALARLEPATKAPADEGAGAESALLLFLRANAEVVRVVVRSSKGDPLLLVGRRGGVPVLWVSSNPTGLEGAAVAPGRPRPTTRVSRHAGDPGRAEKSLEIEVDPALLLQDTGPARSCDLRDAAGTMVAREPPPSRRPVPSAPRGVSAEVRLRVEGWSLPSPWTLECTEPEAAALALVEPVATRYRTTLALNLAVMALTLVLGGFAVQQGRKRARLEARAREEARVRELERRLFHAERLTTVGRLAAGIAHEINNPLEGMANWLSLARDAVAHGETAEAEGHLARVKDGLDRAAGIVRQVLAQSDPAQAPLGPVDLGEVLRETGQFVESRREFRGIDVRVELEDGPLLVTGNRVMLGQAAVNLMLNACEAQPGGGEVRVRARREGSAVVTEFADRGPGVPDADRQRIFEPFFSTRDSTGLGLSICHTIVRQHEGELSVGPREGGGAVFRMRLPATASGAGAS